MFILSTQSHAIDSFDKCREARKKKYLNKVFQISKVLEIAKTRKYIHAQRTNAL